MRRYFTSVISLLVLSLALSSCTANAMGSGNKYVDAQTGLTYSLYKPVNTLGIVQNKFQLLVCGGGRLQERCGGSITAAKVGALSPKQLQAVGLTGAKVRTIDELTQATLAGDVNFKRFPHMSDHEIVAELVPLFGIGQWTVEMFLIFQLGRLDIWPVGDLAVRRGWDMLHKNVDPIKPKALHDLGEHFSGMRSVVAWYCWRAS